MFIEAGMHYLLHQLPGEPLTILEMGFGTGLNALLTAKEAEHHQVKVHYTTLEAFPLTPAETGQLSYNDPSLLHLLHECPWEEEIKVSPFFTMLKINTSLEAFAPAAWFHLVYFDAFAPAAQPQLWTTEIFSRLFHAMHQGGVLVTYCSKGDVRRSLQAAGFTVSKLPGPPGKREMVRAQKK